MLIQQNNNDNEPEEISFNNIQNEVFRINHVPLPSLLKNPKDKEKRETSFSKKANHKQMENLFEEFFVFGVKKQDLIEEVENKHLEQITMPPKILYSYPDSPEFIKKLIYAQYNHFIFFDLVRGNTLLRSSPSHPV